ncbi:hypothetical protein R0790_24335 [Escherichia coli]|uniref:hypothetical protein n=1 Tax=Escherichia albertii TaxID=208962 RepID=UPI0030C95243
MKYFNKLILCAAVATAFGANAATYNREGESTQTIVITKPLTLQALNSYKVDDDKAGGSAIVRTTDGSKANLYIAVAASSTDVDAIRIAADSGNLTLIGQAACGNAVSPVLDTAASRPGANTAAIQCVSASSIATVVNSMEPASPEAGEYTFTQEYGTYVD